MRNILNLTLVALVAGCDGGSAGPGIRSHEEAADATVTQMKAIAGILDAVKDKATAEAAKAKLEAVGKRLQELVAAVEKLGPPADESKTARKIDAAGQILSPTVEAYMARMQGSPEITGILAEPFGAVTGHLMRLRGMLGG